MHGIKSRTKTSGSIAVLQTLSRTHFLFLLILLAGSFWSTSTRSETLRIAVASNFKSTLEILVEAYKNQSETTATITVSSASTGVLYNQIIRGAPFDLFFSADALRPEKLVNEGKGSQQAIYALGLLAFWYPGGDPNTLEEALKELQALKSEKNKLAIANPAIAPYGLASKQVLGNLNLYNVLSGHLVMGNNVSQVEQFISTGAAKAGFIAASQTGKYEQVILIDQDLYSPIEQKMLLINSNTEALSFYHFVLSETGRQIIEQSRYALPDGNSVERQE